MIRKVVMLALAVAVALPLTACGRKGRPIAPEGTVYPRQYPNPNTVNPNQQQTLPDEPQVERQ